MIIQTQRPLDIHPSDLYSSYSNQSEHSSSYSSVSPLIVGAKKPNSNSLKRQNFNVLKRMKAKDSDNTLVPKFGNNSTKLKKIQELVEFYYKTYPDKLAKIIQQRQEHRTLYLRQYKKNNRDKINERVRSWRWNYYRNNIDFKISMNIRRRICHVLKDNYKSKRTMELIGCSIEELKQHLESKFTFGMNWKNYGFGWHVDHIRPCDSFDLSKEEEQEKCFHYTNLQPLWAAENFKKNNKFL